jgi:hypothetical protein
MFVIGCSNQQPNTTETSSETATDEKVMPEAAQNEESAFANLLKSKQNLKYMVEWDISTIAQGQTMNSQMTQYFKDAKHFRTDMITSGMEVRSYLVDDTISSCFNIAGKWNCQQVTYEQGASEQAENNIISGKVDYKVTNLPGRTIAGTSTQCYQAEVEQSKVTYCFSSEGVPLYIKTEMAQATSEMTATKYSTSVADSVFELPQ